MLRQIKFILIIFLFSIQTYLAESPHQRAASVPQSILLNLKKSPSKYLSELTEFLFRDIKSNEEKVRIIHDWIALNIAYDVEGYFSGQVEAYDELDVLRTGKSVCQGYANVFSAMCNSAGIENIIIGGYGRGLEFSVFGGEEKYNANHAWNAVKLSGKWQLIDANWDAGYVGGREFIRKYSTAYYLPDPAEFIYTHFPEKKEHQFLTSPLSFEEFRKLPFLREGFFEYKLKFSEKYNLIEKCSSQKVLSLTAPPDVNLMASLYDNKGREQADKTFVQKKGGEVRVYVKFPRVGEYELILFATNKSSVEKYDAVAHLKFIASSGTVSGFPVIYSDMALTRAVILEPIDSPLKANAEIYFSVSAPGGINLGIFADEKFMELKYDGAGTYRGRIKVAAGDAALCSKAGNRLKFLCKWESR